MFLRVLSTRVINNSLGYYLDEWPVCAFGQVDSGTSSPTDHLVKCHPGSAGHAQDFEVTQIPKSTCSSSLHCHSSKWYPWLFTNSTRSFNTLLCEIVVYFSTEVTWTMTDGYQINNRSCFWAEYLFWSFPVDTSLHTTSSCIIHWSTLWM